MTTPPVLPVIVGADISEYTIARLFHEAYGLRSLVINDFARGPVSDSRILDFRIVDKGTLMDPARLIPLMQQISADNPGLTPIFLGNVDEPLEIAATHREELPGWFLPQPTPEVIARANDKAALAELLESLGLHAPQHVTMSLADPDSWHAIDALRAPLVVKTRSGADFFKNSKYGLDKVSVAEDHDAARALFARVAQARVDLIVQELIPGDDTTQWVVNGYVTTRGRLAAIGSGQVLLGIHEPELIGNAGIIYVREHPELIEQAQRIIRKIGLTGFFSLDVKIDPRDGRIYWLDLNPRMGRGHYYLKVGGIDLARIVVADALGKADDDDVVARQTREGIFAIVPPLLANRNYIRDPHLRKQVRAARRNTVTPLDYRVDQHPKRVIFRLGSGLNYVRRMRKYYPTPTDSGF
ncbi:carboxylate--amine ligase [Trueperella bialowiezensis]|nr:ATP-grasp domain-containing protein [Trueperella bialowiezensis]